MNWALSLVYSKPIYDHDNDQLRVKTKRLARRMTAQPYNRFAFVSWSWHLPCNGKQALHSLGRSQLLTEHSGPVHMIPGQLIAPGQLTDPGVNFASVHGLTTVTVHMSFSLPRGNFEKRVTRCTTRGDPPCRGNFSPCEQNAKVAPGQE